MEYLLKNGANVNKKNNLEDTLLHTAISTGDEAVDPQMLELLLKYGTDVNITNNEGDTPLHTATGVESFLDIFNYLLDHGVDIDTNISEEEYLSSKTDIFFKVIDILLEHHANIVNAINKDGNTPLHLAANEGHLYIAQYLISKYNANVNTINDEGDTPLNLAVHWGHFTLAKYLLEHRADMNITNKDEKNALSIALDNNYKDIYQYLISQKK